MESEDAIQRLEALKLAQMECVRSGLPTLDVVKTAEKFLRFLQGQPEPQPQPVNQAA